MAALGPEARNFYPTWQEASQVIRALGISSLAGYLPYIQQAGSDSRLPPAPWLYYPDFPGFSVFFTGCPLPPSKKRKQRADFYPTWRQAAKAARRLKIVSTSEYFARRTEDARLPRSPWDFYKDFPGMAVFLGLEWYPTWQEASKAVQQLKIGSMGEYLERRTEDARLHGSPASFYKDYPGAAAFLGLLYPTWQEASKAAEKLGILSWKEYRLRYKEDDRLPVSPSQFYKDYPGSVVFFKSRYQTWQEASDAAERLGIRSMLEYRVAYKEDRLLPLSLSRIYKDYPGDTKFFKR